MVVALCHYNTTLLLRAWGFPISGSVGMTSFRSRSRMCLGAWPTFADKKRSTRVVPRAGTSWRG